MLQRNRFALLFLSLIGLCQFLADGTELPRLSLDEVRAKAEAGDTAAEFELSFRYFAGNGTQKDLAKAVEWARKAAEHGLAKAQGMLGYCYLHGQGVAKDEREAVKWYRKAAEQGLADAQRDLANRYYKGEGVEKNDVEAFNWWRKAADQGLAAAQTNVGQCYFEGRGVSKDEAQAAKWYHKAAEQNNATAQFDLSSCYANGTGVTKNDVEAYKWCLLAAAQGEAEARRDLAALESRMSRAEIIQGQTLALEFNPRRIGSTAREDSTYLDPHFSGSGFFITEDGFVITNEHVVASRGSITLITAKGAVPAKIIKTDAATDIALLKATGRFQILSVASSRSARLGDVVATIGFPNISLQGFAPKFGRGEIGSLSGPRDDVRFFQISVPVQPGNSGGALIDERGNVIGIVSAKLSAKAALLSSGALPENVNYAIKSSFLLSFLESVPEVTSKLKEPNVSATKSADAVEQAKAAAVLVLVY